MKQLFNLVLLFVFFLATINLATASQGVVGMVILDSPNEGVVEKNDVFLEENSDLEVQNSLSQEDLKEQYEEQELSKVLDTDLSKKGRSIDQKITGASIIDLDESNSKTVFVFVILFLAIIFLFALFMWLSFR